MPEFPRSWTSPSPEETETLGEALGRNVLRKRARNPVAPADDEFDI